MTGIGQRIGDAIRRERDAAGISVGELARRSSVSKGTLSQLENGTGNPTVETLWAIGDALGVPFSTLVEEAPRGTTIIRADEFTAVPSSAAPYTATLVAASPPNARRDLYLIQASPGGVHASASHHAGTIEHVLLTAGSALAGTADAPVVLTPGDYMSYPADVPHVFEALEEGTVAILLNEMR